MARFLNFVAGKGEARRPWRLVTFSPGAAPEVETFPPNARICEHVTLVVDDDGKGWLQLMDASTLIVTPIK